MTRNNTILAIVATALVAIFVGYYIYEEQQKTGVEITVGESGISIDER